LSGAHVCVCVCVCGYNDRYKVEGVVDADPETVFSYIDPTPLSPRSKWDKAIRELHTIEQLDKAMRFLLVYAALSRHLPTRSCFYCIQTD